MSAPRPFDDVGMHQFGAEVVLRRGDALHLLDPVAAIVWQCLDGEATAAEIVDDLAPVFGRAPEALRADVDAAISSFDAAGLLERAEASPSPAFLDPDGTLFCDTCTRAPDRRHRSVLLVGEHLIVIGTDTSEARDAVESAFAAHVVHENDWPERTLDVPPTFAVTLAAQGPRGLQPLHVLHRGASVAIGSRRARRVLEALPLHIGAHVDLGKVGLVAVPAAVVALKGTMPGEPVILVPLSPRAARRERRGARRGIATADSPVALLDRSTCEVVVGTPGIEVNLAPLRALADATTDIGVEAEPLAWGRYPVAGIGALGATDPTRAMLALAPPAEGWPDAEASLEAIARIASRVEILAIDGLRQG